MMITCPDCGKRRARFFPSDPERCIRCQVRAELARMGVPPVRPGEPYDDDDEDGRR